MTTWREVSAGPRSGRRRASAKQWRVAEEFNVNVPLALDALFVRLKREFDR